MAQKVITNLVDDLDGTEIPDGAGETISFALDGVSYEIDLTEDKAGRLREFLQVYIENGRRRTSSVATSARSSSNKYRNDKEELAAARDWLQKNGHQDFDRGRVLSSLLELIRALEASD